MAKIKEVKSREILDSRGNPTVETEVILENNIVGISSVPSGASVGAHEAIELRDGDQNRFLGLGVLKAVTNVNETLGKAVVGMEVQNQAEIDKTLNQLDGTEHKSKLGANAILSVSQAAVKAAAQDKGIALYEYFGELAENKNFTLPTPLFNVINGGRHADNNLQIQEFMIVPDDKETFREKLRAGAEHFHLLKKTLKNRGLNTAIGDEGGFSPTLPSDEEAIKLIQETGKIKVAIDSAGIIPSGVSFEEWTSRYPIISLEDPAPEDDWQTWIDLTLKLGEKIMIIGDDLFVTDPKRLQEGIEKKAANAILVKPNQIGTITETIEVIKLAQKNNFKVLISHRSGETEDTLIADLAVGVAAPFIKTGAPSRGERVNKYNRLLRIEEALASLH